MGDPNTPRKVKTTTVIDLSISSDNEEVSSTSLDKHDDVTNGTLTSPHNMYLGSGDECEVVGDTSESPKDDFQIPNSTRPAFNVPEKIIIVYDSAIDEVSTGFNNDSVCPTTMLKRSLRFFLYNKHLIDARHEYALIVIKDNAVEWLQDFTSHIDTIINVLEDVKPCETEDILVLDNLFQLVSSKVKVPEVKGNCSVPPPFVVRVLFTYGRSFTMPRLNEKLVEVLALVNSPYFTFDILMTHEMPSATNNCIKIFKDLQLIDKKGFAYFFPVGRSTSHLHLSMAKLLGHPLQRAVQRTTDYSINAMET